MTINQLTEQVLALGFESVIENESAFLSAARRALCQIYSELGCRGRLKLIRTAEEPCLRIEEFEHAPGASEAIELRGTALCFKLCGEGRYTLESGGERVSESFRTHYAEVKKFIGEGARLILEGPIAFRLLDITCYPVIRSSDAADIPLPEEEITLDLIRYAPDMAYITELPRDKSGKFLHGVRAEGTRLTLPQGISGEITVEYRRLPGPLPEDGEGAIDLPAEAEALLPLLTAAYLWLDDEAGKAQYYMQLYREQIAEIRGAIPRRIENAYTDELRWC